ncbi:MAG: AAA family ATPase [Deltaproteobacteria bacterium]|nr:AAA family ATPase [Deltaproteobacteria bacterium]
MQRVPGYHLEHTLCADARRTVYRATRDLDGAEVVLKTTTAPAQAAELARFRRAFELMHHLELPGVCRTLDLFEHDRRPYLVMEDSHGETLSTWLSDGPLETGHALTLGARLAEALAQLHHHGIVHADVNPRNVLLTANGGVQLIDFDTALRLSSSADEPPPALGPEGTLAYIAPEQTGRLHRPVDHRADLYAFGITLYEMLTGGRPFDADTPGGLVHAHLAVAPRPPHLAFPQVPEPVSEMVMRLLAKEPDDRYQTAWGLMADLELCVAQLAGHGRVESFELGAADISTRLRLDQHLHVPSDECTTMLAHLERASQGGAEVLLVTGPSGIGKTTLIQRFFVPGARQLGRVASATFEARAGSSPTSGLRRALGELVQLVLSGPDDEVALTRRKILAALGEDAALVADAVPGLRLLTGELAPPGEVPADEARHRFRGAFRRFMQCLATQERPLVLVLDDLQRADEGALELLQQLILDGATAHFMLVGAYRDDEVGPSHPLAPWLGALESHGIASSTLALSPLSTTAIEGLIAATLAAPTAEIAPLAHAVSAKTQGNALFVGRFLRSLHDDGALRVDPALGRWTWDLDQIRRMPFTENVAALMARRVRLLPEATRHVLAAAACMGVRFDPAVLARALELGEEVVLRDLWPAVRDDFVVPPAQTVPEGMERYRFAHDRVHDAAYELVPPPVRASLHRRIGWALAANQGAEAARAEAATQLGLALPLIQDVGERIALAELALEAGRSAAAAMSHAAARDHLQTGLDALPPDAWESAYGLCFQLHLARAENAELTGEFGTASTCIDTVLQRARSPRERAAVLVSQITLRSRMSDAAGAVAATRECLALFGEHVPYSNEEAAPLHAAADAALDALITGRDPAAMVEGPETEDEDARIIMSAIAAASNPSYTQPWALGTIARLAVRVSLEKGHTPDSAHAFVLYGWMLAMVGQRDRAERFARTGLALSERGAAASRTARLHHLYACFIEHWSHPWSEGRARLERALALARHQGYHETAAWVSLNICWMAFAAEDDLLVARRRIEEALALARGEFEHRDVATNILLTLHRVLRLTGDSAAREELDAEGLGEAELLASLAHFQGFIAANRVQAMVTACLLGELDEALGERAAAEPLLGTAAASLWQSRFHTYGALVLTGLWRSRSESEREGWLEAIEASLGELRSYAELREDGLGAERDLVAAELAGLRGETERASALYDAAIEGAMEAGDRALCALASERCAGWHEARGDERLARSYLFDARHAFERWGAVAKVARLDAGTDLARAPLTVRRSWRNRSGEAALDLHAAMMASRAVSVEIDLDRLLATLITQVIELAGASRGCLLLETEGELRVEAAVEGPDEEPAVMLARPFSEHPMCGAVVQFVQRTGQPVRLPDARLSGRFGQDPHILSQRPRALLCMPITHQGRQLALLYLENQYLVGAFDSSRQHALDLIAAQAAISIQNAFLFRRQSQMAEALNAASTENARLHGELTRALQELKATNARLQTQARSLEATVRLRTADIERMHRHHDRVLSSIDQGILCLDRGGFIYFANPAASRLTGWSHDALVGRSHREMLQSDGGEPLPEPCAGGGVSTRDARFVRASGDSLPVEFGCQPIRDDLGEIVGAVLTFRDVTRRRQLETQLQHAQKMEAMGRFAGGVAHDFNNLLTPMLGNVTLVRDVLGQERPDVLPWLDDIERAGSRAAELVKQVLAFSRRSEVFLRPIDPAPVIEDVVRFLQRSVERSIAIDWEPPERLPWIQADAGGIHQVLLNLGLNARDALRDRLRSGDGANLRLAIRADEVRIGDDGAAAPLGLRPGHWVRMSVEDNGVGMAPATQERVFEPFFTTKGVGEGTGLGLSVVYGIIEQHGGLVQCHSEEGRGTTMVCYLPAREPSAKPASETAPRVWRGRGERVLIADDEPLMRSLGRHLLESLGYIVVDVGSGQAAVDAYRDQPQAFHLVILDLSMPGMPGDEALRQILHLDARARVILWSGYAADTETGSAEEMGARAFVAKPFRAQDLARVVRGVLDSV